MSTLEKIKDLPFDYYQMYDCSPEEIIKSYNLIPTDVAQLQKIKGHDEIFREGLEKSKSVIAPLLDVIVASSSWQKYTAFTPPIASLQSNALPVVNSQAIL